MKEEKNVTNNSSNITSEISNKKNVNTKKVRTTELDSDALLEQIMNKKAAKKKRKNYADKSKKVFTEKENIIVVKEEKDGFRENITENDNPSYKFIEKVEPKNNVELENTEKKDIFNGNGNNFNNDINNNFNSKKKKKKKKRKKKRKNKSGNRPVNEVVEQVDKVVFESSSDQIENIVEEDSSDINEDIQEKIEDTIITRELNFNADQFDIKNEKLLNELKEAIAEYDSSDEKDNENEIESEKTNVLESISSEDEIDSIENIVEEDKNKAGFEDTFIDEVDVVTEKRSQKYLFGDEEKDEDYNTWERSVIKDNVDDEEIKKQDSADKFDVDIVSYDNNDTQKILLILGCILLVAVLAYVLYFYFSSTAVKPDNTGPTNNEKLTAEREEKQKNLYNECLNREIGDSDKTEDILKLEDDLTNYLSVNYNSTVLYEDLTFGYKYSYNSASEYYAASTIKILDALYIYERAINGELDLDTTVQYTADFSYGGSQALSKLPFGTNISLRNLVKYAITVSDNSAHQLLVSYIGFNNLKNYGKSLGATRTLVGSDHYGTMIGEDSVIYLKKLNELINNGGELGQELKSYFVQSNYNDFAMPDLNIEAAFKYGYYKEYYHGISIVFDEHPFILVVLTREGNQRYHTIMQDIRDKVYKLHQAYYTNREKVCNAEVYGN